MMYDDARRFRSAATPPAEPRRGAQLPRFFRWFTEHCVLRQIDAADVPRIWSAVMHPAYERCWTVAIPHSADEVAKMVAAAQIEWQRGTAYRIAVLRKQSQEFIGWVEVRATEKPGAWLLDWFIHPRHLLDPLAAEALAGAADLMFKALAAETLYANCPPAAAHFDGLLNEAGFIELVPAGSLDMSGRPRSQALYELGYADWLRMHGLRRLAGPVTRPRMELSIV
jgi:RimJ/RimL family protein N-acetyltransferase